MILDGNKILLGHRAKNKKDTGGIFEVDCWVLPGDKQKYNETFFEGAKREVKEEANLNIYELELFGAARGTRTPGLSVRSAIFYPAKL